MSDANLGYGSAPDSEARDVEEARFPDGRCYPDWLVPEWIDMPRNHTEAVLSEVHVRDDEAAEQTLLVMDMDAPEIHRHFKGGWLLG